MNSNFFQTFSDSAGEHCNLITETFFEINLSIRDVINFLPKPFFLYLGWISAISIVAILSA